MRDRTAVNESKITRKKYEYNERYSNFTGQRIPRVKAQVSVPQINKQTQKCLLAPVTHRDETVDGGGVAFMTLLLPESVDSNSIYKPRWWGYCNFVLRHKLAVQCLPYLPFVKGF